MKHFLLFFPFAIAGFFFRGEMVFGASIEYASVIDYDVPSASLTMQYGGLQDKSYYECSLVSLLCHSTTSPALYAPLPTFDYSAVTETKRVMFRGHSASGRFIYYYQHSDPKNRYRRHVLLDTETGKTYETKSSVTFLDLMTEQDRLFSVSSDDKTLLYLDDRDGSPAIYYANLGNLNKNSMKGERITKRTYSVADFIAYDKDTVYFIANRSNPLSWSLYRYAISTNTLEAIAENISYGGTLKKIGKYIVALQIRGGSVVPAVYNSETKKISYFSFPQTDGILAVSFPYKIVHYGTLWGTLSYPEIAPSRKNYPLIVWLHGGPYRQGSTTFHPYISYGVYDWILNEARKNGAIVFKLDYSGSYGYGRSFIETLKSNVGRKDVNDVITALASAKKEISKKYPISGVYLVGNSYGGYLSLRSMVAYPKQFAGAFSINGVTDWPALLTDLRTSSFNMYFNGIPDSKNKSLYSKADILERAGDVRPEQKTVLVQAEKDRTIAPVQAELLKVSWAAAGVAVDLISIPEEDHVFRKPDSISKICDALFRFLDIVSAKKETCEFR
jgi:dipeptidyl aminopeptidase/acylaminoacyl peptidase